MFKLVISLKSTKMREKYLELKKNLNKKFSLAKITLSIEH